MECPACKIEMELLLEGIYQCPKCKKIIKEKKDIKREKEIDNVDDIIKNGNRFNLNKTYEIPIKGITIKDGKFAVLICHSAYMKNDHYIRLSWWKDSFIQHVGMIKVREKDVLINMIKALEKVDENFNDFWEWKGNSVKPKKQKTEEQIKKEKQNDILKYRILENKTCPNCQKTMDKLKSYYECPSCGEIVILEGYGNPIFNKKSNELDLEFNSNYPINYYMPYTGITIKWLMADWKSLVIIYSKDNPNRKWLRFYWWVRELQNIMKTGSHEMGEGIQMGWKARKGAGSTNIYDKKLINPLINALRILAKEMNWNIDN